MCVANHARLTENSPNQKAKQCKKHARQIHTHTQAKIIIFHTATSTLCVCVCVSWQLFWIDFLPSMSFAAATAAHPAMPNATTWTNLTNFKTSHVLIPCFSCLFFVGRRDDKNYFSFIQVTTCSVPLSFHHMQISAHVDTFITWWCWLLLLLLLLLVMGNHQNPLPVAQFTCFTIIVSHCCVCECGRARDMRMIFSHKCVLEIIKCE